MLIKTFQWLSRKWNSYKYRFVPWIVVNINDKTSVKVSQDQVYSSSILLSNLTEQINKFQDYSFLRDDIDEYARLNEVNQAELLNHSGFALALRESCLDGAGRGVFIEKGKAPQGSIVGVYPGTVYQPYQPILIQSVRNQFLFRCADGVLVDGNDRGISKVIFKSCSSRDQIGLVRTSDTSWLTPWPVNPLNVGQYVNNGTEQEKANVCYQELDLPISTFPLALRKFIPNVNYASVSQDGFRDLKVVVLVALRDISAGEELFSSYFTIIQA
eukprot:TRINITY_DN3931_c0_g1_i1.p2 TRINITY_DN3931_c0_g1~~TRINITY_DN3931_c0_g1_i1.p2  ORF type:complete len:271 (+),score=36.42 TRINITY_DN3931_c0_g1_i1:27-839(+)